MGASAEAGGRTSGQQKSAAWGSIIDGASDRIPRVWKVLPLIDEQGPRRKVLEVPLCQEMGSVLR
ncbi:hypothetical protein GCM10023354_20550 [Garicola koreensis]